MAALRRRCVFMQMSLITCYIPRSEGSNKQYAAISSSVCPSSVCPMPLIQNGAFKGCVYSLLQNANTGCRTHRSARPQRGRTTTASGRNRRGRRGTDHSAATGTRDVLYHCYYYYYYYYTHPFNGPLYGTTRVSRYQKGKTNLDFTEARGNEWQ